MNDMTLTTLRKTLSRLARLKRRNVISGDAATLWKVKAGRWRGPASVRLDARSVRPADRGRILYRAAALKPR